MSEAAAYSRFGAKRDVNGWSLRYGEDVVFRIDQWGHLSSTTWPASYTLDAQITERASSLLRSRRLLRQYRDKSGWARFGGKFSAQRQYLMEFYATRLNEEIFP